MNVTCVLSSHYSDSFNAKLCSRFLNSCEQLGMKTTLFDLYDMNFDPVMKGDDFNPFFAKPIGQEIQQVQQHLEECDVLAFFYPVWWNDMPAVMKGWIDRVFSKGFAYDIDEKGHYVGKFPVKKVVLICTLGNDRESVVEAGLEDAMRLKESEGVFGYCGVNETKHFFLYDVYKNEQVRQGYLQQMENIAQSLL